MNAPAPVVRDFKPFERNILRGFFDVELASGLILRGYCLHEKNGNFWCGLPAKPYEDKDGKQPGRRLLISGISRPATASSN
jgi:hypothetical protein